VLVRYLLKQGSTEFVRDITRFSETMFDPAGSVNSSFNLTEIADPWKPTTDRAISILYGTEGFAVISQDGLKRYLWHNVAPDISDQCFSLPISDLSLGPGKFVSTGRYDSVVSVLKQPRYIAVGSGFN
jgi:hypothetical protein